MNGTVSGILVANTVVWTVVVDGASGRKNDGVFVSIIVGCGWCGVGKTGVGVTWIPGGVRLSVETKFFGGGSTALHHGNHAVADGSSGTEFIFILASNIVECMGRKIGRSPQGMVARSHVSIFVDN